MKLLICIFGTAPNIFSGSLRRCLCGVSGIASLRFDGSNVNGNATNQWFDWLNEEKYSCCTLFGAMFWRSLPNHDVKFSYLNFWPQRELAPVNLLVFAYTCMKTLRGKQAKVHSAYFVQRDRHGIRELKIWRRQRQRQRHKSMIWLVEWRKIIVLHVRHAFWCNVLT